MPPDKRQLTADLNTSQAVPTAPSIDRRTVLAATAASALSLLATSRPARAQRDQSFEDRQPDKHAAHASGSRSVVTLKLVGSRGASLDWRQDQAYRFCRLVEAMSGGAIQIVEPSEGDSGDGQFLDADGLQAFDPALGYLAGLPGQYAMSAEQLKLWIDGGGAAAISQIAHDRSVVLIPVGHSGRNVLWSRLPPSGSIALAGHRLTLGYGTSVACSGLSRDVARSIGASIADTTHATVVERSPAAAVTSNLITAGLSDGIVTVLTTALMPEGSTLVLQLSDTAVAALGPTQLALMKAAADQSFAEAIADDRANAGLILAHVKWAGMTVHDTASPTDAAIDDVSRAVIAELASSSVYARKLDASYASARSTFATT